MESNETNPSRSTTERWVAAARASIENLRPAELAAELADRSADVVLVDVRSPDEWRSGFIGGSINVPRGALESAMRQPSRRVVVYCDTGARSALAATALYRLGFEDVAHLDGGLDAWTATGHALTIDPGRSTSPFGPTWDER